MSERIYLHCNFWRKAEWYGGREKGCWNCHYRFLSICMFPFVHPEKNEEIKIKIGETEVELPPELREKLLEFHEAFFGEGKRGNE